MTPALEPAALPADAVEVGRIHDAWGVKGWLKIQPHSASPEALFSSRRWYLVAPARPAGAMPPPGAASQAWLLRVREAREHGAAVVACAHDIDDRSAAEALRGARVFVPRSSFPTPAPGEYYWVDLIGLAVVNREGLTLGVVRDLMATGPQTVLVIEDASTTPPTERMIPFVDAFVDTVDLSARRIAVDWQPDY